MFWSNDNSKLREELRLRLRVAADLATLGAYELSGSDELESEHHPVAEPPQRVFMFAKVAPVCAHSAPAPAGCSGRPSAPGRRRGRRRGGAVGTPEQPCITAGARVPAS